MTNGFDISALFAALVGRIGWRQSTIAGAPVLTDGVKASSGGRHYNDVHALCTTVNVKAVQENPAINDAGLNAVLVDMDKAVIADAITAVFDQPETIEQILLYEREEKNHVPVINAGYFVGYCFELAPTNTVAVQVNSATLLFDGDVAFNLYLFKDGASAPVVTVGVSALANELTVVDLAGIVMRYVSATSKGGRYYLGYFQADLGSARAIREQCEFNTPNMFEAEPVYAKQVGNTTNFDRENVIKSSTPFGINLQVTSYRDWTAKITQSPAMFDNLRMLLMGHKVLQQIIYSNRSNGTQRNLLEGINGAFAMAELNGSAPISEGPPPVTGLSTKIKAEVARLKKQFFHRPKIQTVNLC